tara:strand:- start:48 stop:254 length:207 start_codon:yes stop_codon:yes gene_type:complete
MKPSNEAASNLIESLMTDTVIPNAEVREAARDLIESLKADGYTDQSVMAELQQLADGQPIPKEVTNEE